MVVIAEVVRGTKRSVQQDSDSYGRPIPWTTVVAACLAAALYAPLLAGALLAIPLFLEMAGDDTMMIVGAVLLGLIAGLFGLAITFVVIGVAVGSAVLADRPHAWWYARAWAVMGLFFAWVVWDQFGSLLDEARVMGWAMLGMATLLTALALPPRGKPRPVVARRRRFVL